MEDGREALDVGLREIGESEPDVVLGFAGGLVTDQPHHLGPTAEGVPARKQHVQFQAVAGLELFVAEYAGATQAEVASVKHLVKEAEARRAADDRRLETREATPVRHVATDP